MGNGLVQEGALFCSGHPRFPTGLPPKDRGRGMASLLLTRVPRPKPSSDLLSAPTWLSEKRCFRNTAVFEWIWAPAPTVTFHVPERGHRVWSSADCCWGALAIRTLSRRVPSCGQKADSQRSISWSGGSILAEPTPGKFQIQPVRHLCNLDSVEASAGWWLRSPTAVFQSARCPGEARGAFRILPPNV